MTERRIALVAGVAGQDGTCLASLLAGKGYRVIGATRSVAKDRLWRLDEAGLLGHPHFSVEELDLADAGRCLELVKSARPAEIYNVGGLSFIGHSFAQPLQAAQATGLGAVNLLEAIRLTDPGIRYFQASSSEMFGTPAVSPQDEDTPFRPRSPYAAAKLFAHWATITYREAFGIFASSGILYNHESPWRGKMFVTRKITDAVARMRLGREDVLELGNLDARRDWGYAPEYADAMWRILQTGTAGSFVLATGRLASVRDLVDSAFRAIDTEIRWQGQGLAETGVEAGSGKLRVKVSPAFFRPAETPALCGNAAKAKTELGWEAKVGLDEICRLMVEADLKRLEGGAK